MWFHLYSGWIVTTTLDSQLLINYLLLNQVHLYLVSVTWIYMFFYQTFLCSLCFSLVSITTIPSVSSVKFQSLDQLLVNHLSHPIISAPVYLLSQYFTIFQHQYMLVTFKRQLHKNAASNIEQVLETTPHKAAAIRPPTTHHENYQN